ncbi:MAG: 50S ribosomal protein L24 [Candidatus Lokiarchaeota archaeon]|nr:50S ribosomal protein L24 [Candidatus Lokiarchaeota archaeon]
MRKIKTKSPGKQRKRLYTAPNHKTSRLFNVKLMSDLVEQHGVKRLPLRKDDHVMVINGEFKDIEGKVTKIDRKKIQVFIDGAKIEKKGGGEFDLPVHPSKLMITKLKDDKYREGIIERRKREIKEVIIK